MSNLTDDEKANLSPEELAAIEGDEDSRSELEEIAKGDESEGVEGKGESSKDGEGDDDRGGATDAEAIGDDKDGKEGGQDDKGGNAGEEDQDEAASTDFMPRMVSEDVSKLTEQLNTIMDQKKALDTDFENGDLKHAEYMQKRDELSAQETGLRLQVSQAQFAENQNKSTAEQRWEWEQDRFFEDHEIYTKDRLMHAALDAAVKDLAGNKDNAGKSERWFLNEAHRQVSRRFKLEAAPTDKEGDGGKDKGEGDGAETQGQGQGKPKSKAGAKPDLKGIPKTLGNLPAAEDNDAAASEFAALDKLTGMEYEEALARLTPEQQERYAKAG